MEPEFSQPGQNLQVGPETILQRPPMHPAGRVVSEQRLVSRFHTA